MVEVKLLCKLLPAGGYRGQIVVDGAPDPVLHVDPGTCKDLRRLWTQARDKYGVAPLIGLECAGCFPTDFLETESEPMIDRLEDSQNISRQDHSGPL